jgi:hypothetical protein
MTSVLTAQAAATLATTDDFTRAINLAPDDFIKTNVARLGFEFEIFPTDDNGYYDEDDEWVEYDDSPNYSAEVDSLLRRFRRGGLLDNYVLHGYHCGCNQCDYTREGPFLAAQQDCTVGVEFISRIIDTQADDDAWRAELSAMVAEYKHHKQDGGWMPDGHTPCGNHVHISCRGDRLTWDEQIRLRARDNIRALYAIYDWTCVADGGCGRLRGYNAKPTVDGEHGGWLSDKGYGTFEHRQWNTPRDPDRLWAHIGLSLAITRWGFGIALDAPRLTFFDGAPRSNWGGPTISATTVDRLNNALPQIIDVIRGYVPDGVEFDGARDLIGRLATY